MPGRKVRVLDDNGGRPLGPQTANFGGAICKILFVSYQNPFLCS